MVSAASKTTSWYPPPQVKVLELENHLENERLRLGELRKKHYELAGVPLEQISEGNGDAPSADPATMSPKSRKPALMKKPALAQKPSIAAKTIVSEGSMLGCWEMLRFELKSFLCLCFCCSLSDIWATEDAASLLDQVMIHTLTPIIFMPKLSRITGNIPLPVRKMFYFWPQEQKYV